MAGAENGKFGTLSVTCLFYIFSMFGGIISTTKLSEDATWKPGQATSTLCREDEKHEDAEGDADPVPKGSTGRARVRIWSCCLSKKALKKVKDTKVNAIFFFKYIH